ncbi:MAG: hypothetical protein RJR37_10465 [Peptococcaceae bacterium MAG4]|nr:hypothetical protein [Peptococcaceae bacterium MAG4]MDR9787646.1 hypothetical protein [Peptococcaceae bacterium MAG4]
MSTESNMNYKDFEQQTGMIVCLSWKERFGVIRLEDGTDVCFREEAVLEPSGIITLREGTKVKCMVVRDHQNRKHLRAIAVSAVG